MIFIFVLAVPILLFKLFVWIFQPETPVARFAMIIMMILMAIVAVKSFTLPKSDAAQFVKYMKPAYERMGEMHTDKRPSCVDYSIDYAYHHDVEVAYSGAHMFVIVNGKPYEPQNEGGRLFEYESYAVAGRKELNPYVRKRFEEANKLYPNWRER